MKRFRLTIPLVAVLALMTVPVTVDAQQRAQGSPYSIGIQSSWPAYGFSGRYDFSDKVTGQAIVGALGRVTNFAGRVNYYFNRKAKYATFGFGSVGIWRWGGDAFFESQTSLGLGGGAGFEFDWAGILEDDDFPPLFSSLELSLGFADFDGTSLSTLTLGGNIHYHF